METRPVVVENDILKPVNLEALAKRLKGLKNDSLDLHAMSKQLFTGAAAVSGLVAHSLSEAYLGHFYPSNLADIAWNIGVYDIYTAGWYGGVEVAALGVVGSIFYWQERKSKAAKYHDPILHTTAESFVYQGLSLEKEGVKLKKGDKLLYVSLPRSNNPSSSPQAVSLLRDAARIAVSEVKERFQGLKYNAVIVDEKSYSRGETPVIPAALLLAGKDLSPSNVTPYIVSLEAFDSLRFDEKEQLQLALEKLKDPALDDYFKQARKAQSKQQQDFFREEIIKHLKTALLNHTMDHLAMARKIRLSEPPFKHKIYDMVELLVDSESEPRGKLIVHSGSYHDGGFSRRPVHKLLEVEEAVTMDKLDPGSVHYKGQIQYIIYEILRSNPFDQLVELPMQDKNLIAQKLNEIGSPLNSSNQGIYQLADLTRHITLPRIYSSTTRFARRSLLPLFIAGILYSISPVTNHSLSEVGWHNLPVIGSMFSSSEEVVKPEPVILQTDPAPQDNHRTNVPNGIPPRTLDWKVLIRGMEGNSYYTVDTADQINNGIWVINRDRKEILDIPVGTEDIYRELNESVTLERLMEFPKNAKTFNFKLPIYRGTQISYLKIKDLLKRDEILKPDQLRVYRLTDNTLEVEVEQNPKQVIRRVEVTAIFVPTTDSAVKAVEAIPGIDETKLSDDVKTQVANIKGSAKTEDEFIEKLRQTTSDNHLYSLNSKYKDKYATLTSAEELVETVEHDEDCTCDTCNADNVLKSTLGWQQNSFLNIAFGYLNNDVMIKDRSTGKYYGPGILTGDRYHAYAVNNKGDIVDATATRLRGDPETQTYLALLGDVLFFNQTDYSAYSQQEYDIRSKIYEEDRKEHEGEIKQEEDRARWDEVKEGAIPIVVTAVTIFALTRFRNRIDRKALDRKAKEVRRRAFLATVNKRDLTDAYNLFSWMSYGGMQTSLPDHEFSDGVNKSEIYDLLTTNFTPEGIKRYKANLKNFEGTLDRDGSSSLKLRYMAFVLSRR